MIRLFKRLLAWLLEKIAARIDTPPQPEGGYFNKAHDETLQEAVKAILSRTAKSLRADKKKPQDDESHTETDDLIGSSSSDDQNAEELRPSFLFRQKEKFNNLVLKIKALPRWFKLVAGTSLPLCLLYIILYFILITPPQTNSEDIFRYSKGKPLVRLGYVKEWPTSVVITSLLAELMNNNLNVDITTKEVSQNNLPDLWNLLVTDKADITPSVWLPKTHMGFIIDAGNSIIDLNTWLKGARLGLATPSYMNINSIEDLKEYSGEKIIYGIDPSSHLHEMTRKALEQYDLEDFRIMAKSDKFMINKLEKALAEKKDIIIAIWTPHWIFGEWKIKMLEDPLHVYGQPEDIHIVASEKFYELFPDICDFLSNVKLDIQDLSDLMASSRKMNSPGTAASKWLQTNQQRVHEWTAQSSKE